jgi:hypothetical protein
LNRTATELVEHRSRDMPTYHFDYRENGTVVQDRLGSEIGSLEEARAAAIDMLVAMAHERWGKVEIRQAHR